MRCCRSRSARECDQPPRSYRRAPFVYLGSKPGRMTRRRAIAWAALAALLLMLALTLRWATQPSRVAALILDRVGDAMGLEVSASGISEYRLRGTPRLVVRDLVAREPGTDVPLLRADRVYLSLPWSTIRARGADLTVKRIELDAPQLDLAALQRWRASRPPAEAVRIPTLTEGVQIVRGRVIGDGWSIERLALSLPSLYPDAPVAAHVSGRVRTDGMYLPFDLHLALTRPDFVAGLGAVGAVAISTASWRLPMQLKLSGRLHDGADGLGLDRFRLGANARYLAGDARLPFVYGLAGALRYHESRFGIAPFGLAVRGRETVPTLDAHGTFAWQDTITLQLDGALAGWPDDWPALPAPLGQSNAPLPFALAYHGSADLAGETALQLRREETRFDGRFRLPEVLAWLDTAATETPLPPIDGRLTTPKLEIAGATLEGVEIELDDSEFDDE